MEADWEVELGSGAPLIDATWSGFVDLRAFPNRVGEILEIHQLAALATALVRLNDLQTSPVWTSKCDVWETTDFDPYELGAPPDSANHCVAVACYIDLLPRSDQQWHTPQLAVAACKSLCALLREIPLQCCRADLIIRQALIAPNVNDLGITAYLTACSTSTQAATDQLALALAALADSVLGATPPAASGSKLQ